MSLLKFLQRWTARVACSGRTTATLERAAVGRKPSGAPAASATQWSEVEPQHAVVSLVGRRLTPPSTKQRLELAGKSPFSAAGGCGGKGTRWAGTDGQGGRRGWWCSGWAGRGRERGLDGGDRPVGG